jgi:23S rRNA maturation-related 3'-5' exoribonuclease YhaM
MIFYFIASIHLKTFLIALLLYKTLPKLKKKYKKSNTSQTNHHPQAKHTLTMYTFLEQSLEVMSYKNNDIIAFDLIK